jgi:uncharacterized membrane protein HdeD (DUF308 family)
MSNPYQPSPFDSKQFQDQPALGPAATAGSSNWVKQVRIFAVLNAVQGILETLIGFMAAGGGVIFPLITRTDEFQKAQAAEDITPEQIMAIGIFYLVIGIALLASGILRIVAGFQNYRFKGRVLGIVSVFVGIAPVFTGCCAPTAIALIVFGLLILLDPAVIAAFQMARAGRSIGQILAAFDPEQATHPKNQG